MLLLILLMVLLRAYYAAPECNHLLHVLFKLKIVIIGISIDYSFLFLDKLIDDLTL